MTMATGFGAPLTSARRGASRRDSWGLRLKEGRKGRKRGLIAVARTGWTDNCLGTDPIWD
jgi:hypothetical protein